MSIVALKIKEKKPGQRACDEKDAKGKACVGHLKRWYYSYPQQLYVSPEEEEALREFGKDAEIYRCERCHTVYRPVASDRSTAGQKYQLRPVNILGAFRRKDGK